MDSGLGEAKGRARSEKILGSQGERGNVSPRFLPPPLLKGLKIPCSRPQIRDLGRQVSGLGMSTCKDSDWPEGPASLTATRFRDCSALTMH